MEYKNLILIVVQKESFNFMCYPHHKDYAANCLKKLPNKYRGELSENK